MEQQNATLLLWVFTSSYQLTDVDQAVICWFVMWAGVCFVVDSLFFATKMRGPFSYHSIRTEWEEQRCKGLDDQGASA